MKSSLRLWLFLIQIIFLATAAASTANGAQANSDKLGIAGQPSGSETIGGWHFVRTPNPRGGADAISIMHTADTSRSDFDVAGLMIRCGKGPEVLIILLRPFPLRQSLKVVFGEAGNETRFDATVAPPGTAVQLQTDATHLVTETLRTLKDLFIRLEYDQTTIRGVVALEGLQPAFKKLMASCPTQ